MGGGTLWRSVARAVGAAAPTVAVSNAAFCSACTATDAPSSSSPRSAVSVSCTCQATAIQHPSSSVKFGPRQFQNFDDWEFAGDEERDHFVFGSLPTVKEVEEASSDLQNALRLGFLAPPMPKLESSPTSGPSIVDVTDVTEVSTISTVTTVGDFEGEVNSPDLSAPPAEPDWIEPPAFQVATTPKGQEAPSSAMLEAFHQFQHNPQVQGMVVSLATDKGVWEAVLANQKIQEYRQNFNVLEAAPEVGTKVKKKRFGKRSQKNVNVFSRIFWSTKKAFNNFLQNFQDFMTSLFETADKKVLGNEKTNIFERSVKACMMLAMVVLAIVVFKRSTNVKRG